MHDQTIGRSLLLYGEFAEGENRVMARYLPPGGTAVDVGANVGTTALPMAHAVGRQGHVLAFEPQPLMAQLLSTTLTLNDIHHVRVIPSAVGAERGWGHINAPGIEGARNYGAVALVEHGLPVPVLPLDEWPVDRLDLLKIDVEGHEWSVIQGAQSHLLAFRPVVYFEAKRIPGTQRCLQWLIENGWRCYWHFAFFFRPDNFRAHAENVFGGTGDMNVLAVPAEQDQPTDLPLIASAQENWQHTYASFYQPSGVPMI